jgi:N6-adenosine-specific RNA methylase IME4
MNALLKYDVACRALAEAVSADEVMAVRLEAKALEALAKAAGNLDIEIGGRKLRTRAETRLGEMLVEGEEKGIVATQGRQSKGSDPEPLPKITLKDIGVDKKLSARARKLGGIGQRAVEAMLVRFENESRDRGRLALDVLDAQERDTLQKRRRDLEQELSDASALLVGGQLFANIYADPATRFLSGFGDRSIENHYVTMTTEQLFALPVRDRALPNSRLFIWSTVPQLANTFKIAEAWGFPNYSSHMIWDKTSPDHPSEGGTGHVFINQHELLLYFKRGSPAGPTRGAQALSIYRERKREHSRKPDYFREMITEFTGGQDVLELFARVDAEHPLPPNFKAWGNEAELPPHNPETGEITVAPDHGDVEPASVPHPPTPQMDAGSPFTEEPLEIPAFLRIGDPACNWRGPVS